MSVDLESHLSLLCGSLDLPPVLRLLRERKLITQELCEELKNKAEQRSSHAANEAFAEWLIRTKDNALTKAFLDALGETRQQGLAEKLDAESEAPEAKRRRQEGDDQLRDLRLNAAPEGPREDDLVKEETQTGTSASSGRMLLTQDVLWKCPGVSNYACQKAIEKHWTYFMWCRKCERYLCHECLHSRDHERMGHEHRPKHWLKAEDIVDAAYPVLKSSDAKAVKEIGRRVDKVMVALSTALKERLRQEAAGASLPYALRRHFKVDQVKTNSRRKLRISKPEAEKAAAMGAELAGQSVPQAGPLEASLLSKEPEALAESVLAVMLGVQGRSDTQTVDEDQTLTEETSEDRSQASGVSEDAESPKRLPTSSEKQVTIPEGCSLQ